MYLIAKVFWIFITQRSWNWKICKKYYSSSGFKVRIVFLKINTKNPQKITLLNISPRDFFINKKKNNKYFWTIINK